MKREKMVRGGIYLGGWGGGSYCLPLSLNMEMKKKMKRIISAGSRAQPEHSRGNQGRRKERKDREQAGAHTALKRKKGTGEREGEGVIEIEKEIYV